MLLTDLRLQSYIELSEIKIQNFDFTLVSNLQNKEPVSNVLIALSNISFFEQYSTIDFSTMNYVKSNTPPNQRYLDNFILNNKNMLF